MTESPDAGPHQWITDFASDFAREHAQATGYDPERTRWEMFVDIRHGYPAIVILLDYALAMCLWTAHEEARQHGRTRVGVDSRTVSLVGLALYVAAERGDIHDLSYVNMRPAVDLLATDAQAREIALTEPGAQDPTSRFREDTRQQLDALLTPERVVEWERIRDAARHVLQTNSDSFPGKAFLFPRNSQISGYGIRRRWYLHPDLPALVPPDADEDDASEGILGR
jgi:hypothetical protein